jgi:hypothetical protein
MTSRYGLFLLLSLFFSPTNNGRKITVVSDEKMHIMQQVPAIQDSLKQKSLQPIFCRALGSKTRPWNASLQADLVFDSNSGPA